MAGTLYLVATPIGNLQDITQRALRVLARVAVVACEDTRRTRVLLDHYQIGARLVSYHEHNERERAAELVELLEGGSDVAVVSDAGTPGISDPGFRLVQEAAARGLAVVPVPGPTAFVAALVASGLPTDSFFFGGFLPARSTQRRARLMELRALSATLIFYEAPHRIREAVLDAREVLGERRAVVVRELTKLHEEVLRASLTELAEHFAQESAARGEMVFLIDRSPLDNSPALKNVDEEVARRVAAFEHEGLSARDALKRAARELGLSRSEAYRRLTVSKGRARP
ncbi:MAG TPA: 16S rRNA (cytidine(1402)-2'-O)-methyltransferase [Pyrinomonadaceae bacterium]|jgi:16S rRNA (cytidine1402-2'-O)-methyltransferase